MKNYLTHLNTRLAEGLDRTPQEFRQRHAGWLLGRQNPDGGFSGREGDSDLYYTGFALRGLSVLDSLTPAIAQNAGQFLKSCLSGSTSVVDFFSFLYASLLIQVHGGGDVLAEAPADWPLRVAAVLDTFRTKDQGYNKSQGANSGSTYHTFLVGLCFQLLGRDFPDPTEVENFVLARRREDGGFVEVGPMRRSGTNPTAAAIGILHLLKGLTLASEIADPVIDFLADMPSDEGGLRANDRIPLADLLSTFTGLWTLELLGQLQRVDRFQALDFAHSLALPDGGFKGGLWDDNTDVEYTFYGLGVIGLLS